jgi:hypothetical protein
VRLARGNNPQLVERAYHGPHRARGDLGVERSCLELAVTEQGLDHADIDAVFQQMGSRSCADYVVSNIGATMSPS